MNKQLRIFLATTILSTLNASAMATTGHITTKLSTMGMGVEYTHPITNHLSIAVGANKYSNNESTTESDIDYNGKLDWQSFSILGNYHPFENGFRMRFGAYYNNNKIHLDANSSTGDLTIGNETFTGADIELSGTLDFDKFSPYIGIGYGIQPFDDSGLSVDFDMGVMRSPINANLSGTCSVGGIKNAGICGTSNFDSELAREQKDLKNSVDDYDIYPVVSLGLSYQF